MMHVTEKIEHLQIPLESIKLATNNFADENCIGRGGFGKVYKGKLVLFGIPMIVAIKRLDPKFGQGNSEFLKEIVTLSSYKHENIVSILGFCDENVEKILIYEYASKGSLNSYLNNGDLKWIPRLNICIGAARGLAYLHDFGVTHRRVLHRDIKSSNILLDENWNARITDLGLSKFGLANQQYTFLVSNNGYCCDPLYVETGLLTEESDVYSFGVVLFEVLCDRLSIGNNSDKCRPWTELVRQYYEEGNINEIIQANLKDQITSSSLQVFTKIAYQCLSRELNRRPEMTEVVSTLEKALQYQFLQWDDTYLRDTVGMDVSKGITFTEVNSVRASGSKVVCCHFSSDGKLLASGGHDKKAVVWYTDSLKPKTILEGHSLVITDVRFSTIMSRLATSSFDKTVRGWDAESSGFPLHTFTGHSAPVLSLDFHPNINDLLCSCDGDGEIRYWSIQNGSCTRVFKERMNHVRFQPRHGRFLAAAAPKIASILDIETQACQLSLQGHTNPINFVCWDPSGEYLASLSEDSVRVWSLTEGVCVRDLSSNGNQFHSCVFHPSYASVLVIGCYKSLELWNLLENNTMTLSAHEGLIAGLAGSTTTGLVASAGHDKIVTLWN